MVKLSVLKKIESKVSVQCIVKHVDYVCMYVYMVIEFTRRKCPRQEHRPGLPIVATQKRMTHVTPACTHVCIQYLTLAAVPFRFMMYYRLCNNFLNVIIETDMEAARSRYRCSLSDH